jgi:hypothetical protein
MFSNPTHKTLETGTASKQVSRQGDMFLIATHLDQSNYLATQKHRAVDKYDLIVYISSSGSYTKRLVEMLLYLYSTSLGLGFRV